MPAFRLTAVHHCQSRRLPAGGSVWACVLACGTAVEVPRQARDGGKVRPAPVRVRCRCGRCR